MTDVVGVSCWFFVFRRLQISAGNNMFSRKSVVADAAGIGSTFVFTFLNTSYLAYQKQDQLQLLLRLGRRQVAMQDRGQQQLVSEIICLSYGNQKHDETCELEKESATAD